MESHTLQVIRTLDDFPGVQCVAAAFSSVGELLAVSSVGPHRNYLEIRDAGTLALICQSDNVSGVDGDTFDGFGYGGLCLRFVPYSQQQIHLAVTGRQSHDGRIGVYSLSLDLSVRSTWDS